MKDIDALRAVDFDWAMRLKSVWADPTCDVPELHESLRREFVRKLEDLAKTQETLSPLGWVMVGSGGTGKTHLLSILRREALRRRVGFVLVDMTDVHDFWETVLLGYISSLQQAYEGDKLQHEILLELFINELAPKEPLEKAVRKLRKAGVTSLVRNTGIVLKALANKREPKRKGVKQREYRKHTIKYQDVIRALIALNSDDFNLASIGHTWLQGHPIDDEERKSLGFRSASKSPLEIVEALSWIMSLVGPTVLAFDQLDPIVAQLNIASAGIEEEDSREETRLARAIVQNIGGGLAALPDITQRTWTVVSCIEATWNALVEKLVLKSNTDRFERPRVLPTISSANVATSLVASRLNAAYQSVGYTPAYPTWPYDPQAFESLSGVTPREILRLCYEHQRYCLKHDAVTELRQFSGNGQPTPGPRESTGAFQTLDAKLEQYRQAAQPAKLLEEKFDDERLAPLLQSFCRCLAHENPPPPGVDAVTDVSFQGGKSTRPLHARLRLIYHNQGDREEHFCFRALQRRHASAFQARLKAAMTQAGIDARLSFRRLVLLRRGNVPDGAVTKRLVDDFRRAGGLFVNPSDDELRTLWALHELTCEKDAELFDWLQSRKPASRLSLAQVAAPALSEAASKEKPVGQSKQPGSPSSASEPTLSRKTSPTPTAKKADPPAARKTAGAKKAAPPVDQNAPFPLGLRLIGTEPGAAVTMPIGGLEKHTVILAGAGSGKTVLVRRLVEEAALQGIPSIVIDSANDLATLGDPWPQPPDAWRQEDPALAESYLTRTEVVVWTPAREAGNPIVLEPLPDLAAVADDREQLDSAVQMARDSLRKMVAPGNSAAAKKKIGILSSALKFLAGQGTGSLRSLIALLADLPADAGIGVEKEAKLAREMSDQLRAEIATNVLFGSSGTGLDPGVLFGDTPDAVDGKRTRVSVINFIGLPGLESQRLFLNQLAMTLFSWIKKHPNPPGRPLRGLLVIDEAKDFIPSRGDTACKGSLMRLTAQARKYHLGLVFATQNPRELENTIIANCSTHFYGKANSPAAVDTIKEQIQLKGGSGSDIPTLPRGNFYVYNADADMKQPTKVLVPLCLSHHRADPLEEEEILRRAARSRQA